jgi:galactose mutarotase-like enzyme
MILDGSRRLAAGDLEAVFLPAHGMLGASLRHRGVELLRRVDDLEAAAAKGSTAGIPLLHPWANRLQAPRFRAAGREVALDMRSPLLHGDENGLPIHGVPWSRLVWQVADVSAERLIARLDWRTGPLLDVFPFPHSLEMSVSLAPDSLTIATTLSAGAEGPVPVAFGFHPYVGLSGVPRSGWRLELPSMRRLVLDERRLPTGKQEPFPARDAPLGGRSFDDGFALDRDGAVLAISGGGLRIAVELVEGYRWAQVYAPPDRDFVALEPMTAPTNALASGRGLTVAEAGERFLASFRIRIES